MKNTSTPTTQDKKNTKPVSKQTIRNSEDDKIANALNMNSAKDSQYDKPSYDDPVSTEFDESDDLEAAKRTEPTVSEQMQNELEPIPMEKKDIAIHNEEPDLDKDFKYARANLYDIIERGSEALNNIVDLAGQSQHPRSYEVVADLVRTLSQTNKDLIELNKKVNDINPKSQEAETINNNLFVTAELTELLKGNARDFLGKEAREVIDVESSTPLSGESEAKES